MYCGKGRSFIKGTKKHADQCIVELNKHVGIFKNKREVPSSCTSEVFLKIPKCLYNSTIYKEQDFYYFYKIINTPQ